MFMCFATKDVYSDTVEDTFIETAETFEEAKKILLEWDDTLDEEYDEMWVVNSETEEEYDWVEIREEWV